MPPTRRLIAIHLAGQSVSVSFAEGARRATVPLPESETSRTSDVSTPDNVKRLAVELKRLLAKQHIKVAPGGGGVALLTVPGSWCLAATISTDGLLKRRRREGMVFRLEEKLPLDAEAFAADFIDAGGDTALGVCTDTARLKPLIDALEEVDLAPAVICPAPLLALQTLLDRHKLKDVDAAILGDGDQADLFTLRAGKLTGWRRCPHTASALTLELCRLRMTRASAPRVLGVNLDEPVRAALASMDQIQWIEDDADDDSAGSHRVLHTARSVALSGHAPPVNLRRDALAPADPLGRVRRPLTALAVAAICFVLIAGGSMLWRGHHYHDLANRLTGQQTTLFHTAFPDQPVPLAVLSRLQSEAQRLAGISGDWQNSSGSNGSISSARASDLAVLQAVLSGLPRNLRYKLLELRLEGPHVYLAGQARAHSAADVIVMQLRRTNQLNIDPPRTQNLQDRGGRGVSFTITGTAAPHAPHPPPPPHTPHAASISPAPSVAMDSGSQGGGS